MPRSGKLHKALGILAAVNRQNRFRGVAMAFCNEMAAQWRCERVSIGFLKGRYVQVKAMSHTEQFSRKMRLVQDIEAAMEECLDQDCEVLYPSQEAACISRAAGELSASHGGKALLSLPLRHEGKPCAVVTLERGVRRGLHAGGSGGHPTGVRPGDASADEPASSTIDGSGPGPPPGSAARWRRSSGRSTPGPKWPRCWPLRSSCSSFFAKGWYRVKAPFVVEAVSQYKIAAPFDGFIKSVELEVGDSIVEGPDGPGGAGYGGVAAPAGCRQGRAGRLSQAGRRRHAGRQDRRGPDRPGQRRQGQGPDRSAGPSDRSRPGFSRR